MNAVAEVVAVSTEIAEYQPIAAVLAELHKRYARVVYDVRTTPGMEMAKAARKELRDVRINLEDIRKELKAPALKRAKAIDEEAKAITEKIVALESPIAEQIEAEAKREEREKQERIEKEQRRVAEIQTRVNAIRWLPSSMAGRPSESIEKALVELRSRVIGPDFEEFQREAEMERATAVQTLSTVLAGAQAQESEAEKVAAERAELARLRKEADEREARDAAERKASIEAEAVAAKGLLVGTSPTQPHSYSLLITTTISPKTREQIFYDALIALREIVMPGSEEEAIIEAALREAGGVA